MNNSDLTSAFITVVIGATIIGLGYANSLPLAIGINFLGVGIVVALDGVAKAIKK